MNIPNLLTLFRIACIPLMALLFYLPYDWHGFAAALVFTLASITDWLDGWLARKLGQMTPLGAFLDPVADKLIVAVALVVLVHIHATTMMAVAAMVIIGREIVISALREWMAEIGKRSSVAVSFIGKFKTALQMIAIIGLLGTAGGYTLPYFLAPLTEVVAILSLILLYVAVVLTIWSMVMYLRAAWPDLLPTIRNEV